MSSIVSECQSNFDCTEANKNTCKDNVCVCNPGFIASDGCCVIDDQGCFKKPCIANGLDGICRGKPENCFLNQCTVLTEKYKPLFYRHFVKKRVTWSKLT